MTEMRKRPQSASASGVGFADFNKSNSVGRINEYERKRKEELAYARKMRRAHSAVSVRYMQARKLREEQEDEDTWRAMRQAKSELQFDHL